MVRYPRWVAGVCTVLAVVAMQPVAMTMAAPTATTRLAQRLLPHLEARQTRFTLDVGATPFRDVMPALQSALGTDDYLREDYRSASVQATSLGSDMRVTFSIHYDESAEQVAYVKRRVASILKQIIQPSMTALEKEKAIHDYIVLHTAYDQTLVHTTPYDALTLGTTVCQGYAMLAYLMLRDVGIPSHIVDGVAGGQAHAWVKLKIQGEWYNLDVTWDDPVPDQPGRVSYSYFNVTDAQLRRDHSWTASSLPSATTDFVTWLAKHARGTSPVSRQYNQIFQSTGLYLETPAHTVTSLASLQRVVNRFHGKTLSLRFPSASIQNALTALTPPRAFSVSYEQDARDPLYALVTFTFT